MIPPFRVTRKCGKTHTHTHTWKQGTLQRNKKGWWDAHTHLEAMPPFRITRKVCSCSGEVVHEDGIGGSIRVWETVVNNVQSSGTQWVLLLTRCVREATLEAVTQ